LDVARKRFGSRIETSPTLFADRKLDDDIPSGPIAVRPVTEKADVRANAFEVGLALCPEVVGVHHAGLRGL